MSATLEPRAARRAVNPENRVVLRGIGWSLFRAVADAREKSVPRLTYLDGDLELMRPSYEHELLKGHVCDFVKLLARGLQIPSISAASTLWAREDLDRGKEADGCFYIANEPAARGLKTIDLTIQPPPDLVIEIEISRRLVDGLRVLAGLGVPEVWTFDGVTLRFLHLGDDGTYGVSDTSRAFPALHAGEVLTQLSSAEELSSLEWWAAVEMWVRDVLAPRWEGA